MLKRITEATITIEAHVDEKISKELPVFYNPAMKLNRDISVLLLKAVDNKSMLVCDLLAGTGIRAIRFLAELPKGKIESITINDSSEDAAKLIKKNIAANKKLFKDKKTKINVTTSDASLCLLNSTGFDYIDIDPFGTPNPFLDAAVKRLGRDGFLGVTATDTSSLAGTFPLVCKRRYWAMPDRGYMKHEMSLRIIIRKVQLVAAQYEKALTPIFSFAKEHYIRVFFSCKKSKSKADEIIKQHDMFKECGPMWLGQLWDRVLVDKMDSMVPELGYDFDARFLQLIKDESRLDIVGFHDIHGLCEKLKVEVPKFDAIFAELEKKKLQYSRTHFLDYGVKCSISESDLMEIIKKLVPKR